ncbi:MAG: TetR/AcrR family transcriptional regulator [Pseudonocardia sp.]
MFRFSQTSSDSEQCTTVPDVVDESSTRARTRRAILDAGVRVLSRHVGASLAEVATAAGVGRTTMHRYFPERADLLAGISVDLLEQIDAATVRARPDEGPAVAALERVCQSYFALQDGLRLMLNEPQLFASPHWEEVTDADRALLRIVERGQAAGTMDPDLTPAWVLSMLWSLLHGAWLHVDLDDVPEHDALALCLRTLRKAVAAP